MIATFDLDELRGLCFDLEIDHEELPHSSTKSGLVQALIKYTRRRGIFDQLLSECEQKRPQIAWRQLESGITDTQLDTENNQSQMNIRTGNIENSQINISGRDITIQHPDPSDCDR
jgi:hypothetical protein